MTKHEIKSQKRLVTKTFDKKAKTYSDGYSDRSGGAHSFTIHRKRVYELINDCKSGKVLDVGCGPGIMVNYFVKRGFEFFGVDISKEMINKCKRKYGHLDGFHFSVGNIEKLEFPDLFRAKMNLHKILGSTFDDGYKSVKKVVQNITKEEIPVCIYLATYYINTGKLFFGDKLKILAEYDKRLKTKLSYYREKIKKINQVYVTKRLNDILSKYFLKEELDKILLKNKEIFLPLSWNELSDIKRYNVQFGAHSHNHYILPIIDDDLINKEIKKVDG